MKKLILFLLFVVTPGSAVATPVSADWVRIGANRSGSVHYLDTASIVKSGNKIKASGLVNYKAHNSKEQKKLDTKMGMRSQSYHVEFDCKELKSRLASNGILSFSEFMGKGSIKNHYHRKARNRIWMPTKHNTLQYSMQKYLCKRRK